MDFQDIACSAVDVKPSLVDNRNSLFWVIAKKMRLMSPSGSIPTFIDCDCVEDSRALKECCECLQMAVDPKSRTMAAQKFHLTVTKCQMKSIIRSDYWVENCSILVCGKCGRMWDGKKRYFLNALC